MRLSISPELQRASLAVRSTLERLRIQVRDAKARPVPGNHPGPILWLSLIEGEIDTAEKYLENIFDRKFGKDPLVVISNAAVLVRAAYELLDEMAGFGLEDVPYPIVPPLQRWFKTLGINNTVVFRAKLEDKYEIAPFEKQRFQSIRNASDSLKSAISKVHWDVLRITIPSRAFSYLPHAAIVAHEIGHALYHKIPWDLSTLELGKTAMRLAVEARISSFDETASKLVSRISSKWHQELAADAVSYYLAGPAAFFALSDSMMYMGRSWGLSETHPPNALRRQILFQQLTNGGRNSFAAAFEHHTKVRLSEEFNSPLLTPAPSSDDIFDFYRRRRREEGKTLAAVLSELPDKIVLAVPSIYNDVHKFLSRKSPKSIYTTEHFDRDLGAHLESLLFAVPPIETGADLSKLAARANLTTTAGRAAADKLDDHLRRSRPVGFASILNIGWAALLTKHSEFRVRTTEKYNKDAQKLEKLHGLLLKAVELSEALRSWRENGGINGSTVGIRNSPAARSKR